MAALLPATSIGLKQSTETPVFAIDHIGYRNFRLAVSPEASKAIVLLFRRCEVLKGRRASPFLGSFPVGPKTGVNVMLVEDSFANLVILSQKTTQRHN